MVSLLTVSLLTVSLTLPALSAEPPDLEERVRSIAQELRCVVCQNLSVADSPSELAKQMRDVVREQLRQGKSPDEIKAYFVSKYGDWVLLAPPRRGFSLLVWVLPFVAAAAGLVLVVVALRRWVRRKKSSPPPQVDPELLARVHREAANMGPELLDPEAEGPRAQLLRDQARFYADIKELDFDYQAGKLSAADYTELRQELEAQAASVLWNLELTPPPAAAPDAQSETQQFEPEATQKKRSARVWRIAAGAIFLVLFGLTLGVFLSQSLRPRLSEQDTITGGFLTGTGEAKGIQSLLAQGRSSFEREEWPQAIEAFKGVLAVDPSHPEAHSYMGLILARAGHPDGALMAFDRALATNPNFPLALWGKGMLLYRVKEDFSGAKEILQKLLVQMPPGTERTEIEKALAEIADRSGKQKSPTKKAEAGPTTPQGQRIQGIISVAPKLQAKLDSQTALFIIARTGGGPAGPPLAVKKIDRPAFPVSYSLGPEDIMMAGTAFAGEVHISARLDKDGNPITREAGNLAGEFRNNPVTVGSQKVDIVLDRVM